MDPDHTLQLVDARRLHHALRVGITAGRLSVSRISQGRYVSRVARTTAHSSRTMRTVSCSSTGCPYRWREPVLLPELNTPGLF